MGHQRKREVGGVSVIAPVRGGEGWVRVAAVAVEEGR